MAAPRRGSPHSSGRDPPWSVPCGGAHPMPPRFDRPRPDPGAVPGRAPARAPAEGRGGSTVSPENSNGQEGERRATEVPRLLPVLPLREGVIFPMSVSRVVVQDERAVRAVEDAMRTHRFLCTVARREEETSPADPGFLYSMGCAVAIHQFQRAPDGPILIVLQGLERVRIQRFVQTDPYFIAETEPAPDQPSSGVETEALVRRVRVLFHDDAELDRSIPKQVVSVADGLNDPRQLAYLVAA